MFCYTIIVAMVAAHQWRLTFWWCSETKNYRLMHMNNFKQDMTGELTHFSIIDRVKEDARCNYNLGKWSDSVLLGLHVLVLPTPKGYEEIEI